MESLTQTFLQIDGVLAANQTVGGEPRFSSLVPSTIATGIVKAHEAANHLALVTGIDAIPEAIDFAFPE